MSSFLLGEIISKTGTDKASIKDRILKNLGFIIKVMYVRRISPRMLSSDMIQLS